MFTSGERTFNIFDVFFIIMLLLSITQIVFCAILKHQIKSKLEYFKEPIIKVKDIPILLLKFIKFTQDKKKPSYYQNIPNLGLAGELILDCYSGFCTEEKLKKVEEKICLEDEDDNDCYKEDYFLKYYEDRIDYKCSFECFESKENTYNNCTDYSFDYIDTKGKDNYSYEKYCFIFLERRKIRR